MKESIRIAAGLGFYGDAWEPVVASIERGQIDYVVSDHLAELTLAILQKDRQRDPAMGYARDVIPMLVRLWPLMQAYGVRFICNAGGLNPQAAGLALRSALQAKGLVARIAVVSGDDVLSLLPSLQPAHMFNAQAFGNVQERMLFANAYLGARPIVDALKLGADIVVTGRVADAALSLAPLVHEFGWKLEDATNAIDLNLLAQGVAVGHLLECSGQGAGGNFGSQGAWKNIPDLAHIGYPIAQVHAQGDALLTKAVGTGGLVNFDTLRQQLLYEVHDPHSYATPDVVLDLGALKLEDLGENCVRMTGAIGHARPAQLKLVGGYQDGYKAEVTWGFSWPDAWDKAQAAIATIRNQLQERRIPHDELFIEYPGLHSAHGALARQPTATELADLNEVWTRMVLRTPSKAAADGFGRLFPWMGLSGPAYTCGFTGLHNTGELLGIWPALIDRTLVEPQIKVELI